MRGLRHNLSLAGALVALMACAHIVSAAGEARYDIVDIQSEELSNAVQVKIVSNGNISFNMDKWSDGWSYTGYTEPGSDGAMASRAIAMNIPNATSAVGNYVYVGKYPVSHVELSAPPEKEIRRGREAGFSLDVVVCLYTGAKMRMVNGGDWNLASYDSQIANANQTFDVVFSQDRRSIIVTVTRDQQLSRSERLDPKGVTDAQRKLSIGYEDGLLEIHARNAELSQLMSAVMETTGRRIMVDPDTRRLVSAELKRITPDDLISKISECYGLELGDSNGVAVLSDVLSGTTSSFTSSQTHRLPVRNTKAEYAREMLPTFLMEYVSVDRSNNELIVSGSQKLAAKIKADLEILDQAPPMVSMKIRLVETSSGSGLEESLGLSISNKDDSGELDNATGELVFSRLEAQPKELEAGLKRLVSSGNGAVRSEAEIVTANGRAGQIFAGASKYIVVSNLYGENEAIPVSAGTRLKITPQAGREWVTVSVSAEMKAIEAVGSADNLPTVNTRTVDGSFRVRSGETLLIGGLSQSQPQESVRKIPILGSLPILGKLFQSKSKQQAATELAILITPTIM